MKFGRVKDCIELSETIYEDYESSNIRRSTFVISSNDFNECTFYNEQENVVAKFKLPINVYNEQFGMTISYDNTKVFLQRWSTQLRCYSIPDGKMLWRSKLIRVNHVFSFEDLLFCNVYCKGIYAVDANTGEIIDRPIKKNDYCQVYRVSKEVFFLYEGNKMVCYNMATRKLWEPDIELGLRERAKVLLEENVITADRKGYVIQNVQDLGDKIIIKFFITKIDRKNDEVFKEIQKREFIQKK